METLENLLYSNDQIVNHAFHGSVGTTLQLISERDYPRSSYFNQDIAALDMDKYEQDNAHYQRQPTMDAVIGIETFNGHTTVTPRLLMVELRMNYKSANHLSVTELTGKVNHTRALLSGGALSKYSIFLFTKTVAPLARSVLARQARVQSAIKDYIVWSTDEFNQNILDSSNYPYVPLTDLERIIQKGTVLIQNGDADGLLEIFTSTIELASSYQYTNRNECDAIITAIKRLWTLFLKKKSPMSPDEVMLKDLLYVDYKDLLE